MNRSRKIYGLLAVFSLLLVVIWPGFSFSGEAPQLQRLGQITAGLRVPSQLELDAAGNLYVADARLQRVVKFDQVGRQIQVYDQVKASGAGLAVDRAGNRIYVAAGDQVVVYAADGSLLGHLGKGSGEFAAAGSMAIDSDGNIYVADLKQGQVKVYNPQFASTGTLGSVTFVASSDLAVNPQTDQIYIAESATAETSGLVPQVHIYDRSGNQLRSIAAADGFGSETMLFFGGMSFDTKGRLYIGDLAGQSLRILDAAGNQLLNYQNQISRPTALAFDPLTSRLFVLKSDRLIEIFGVDGGTNPQAGNQAPLAPIPVAPVGGSEVASPTPDLQFNNAIDSNQLDEISYSVRVYTADQQLVSSFDLQEQPLQTSARVSEQLEENALYFWQVQAFDGQEVSAWSELQKFYVNALNEAPSAPELLAPLEGTKVQSDDLLQWQAAVDLDPFDCLDYLVEVASEPSFSAPLLSHLVADTQLPIEEIGAALTPGTSYYWRVTARDNHALQSVSPGVGQFSYQATALEISVNVPNARVYLGGHQGYAGQSLGEAPLGLRDLQPGRYQLVVERAGFEPYLSPIEILADSISQLQVQLTPALIPAGLEFTPLPVAGRNQAAQLAQIADLDLDGVEDLLLAAADGKLHFHPGRLANATELESGLTTERQLSFGAEELLEFPQLSGASPCLIDWNNDFHQDLLIGGADGSVRLYLNQGDFSFAADGLWLTGVSGEAAPAVGDIDRDGDKDLLIGSNDGELVLLENIGSDAEPQLAEARLLVNFAGPVAPTLADWNGDGWRELLITSEGALYRADYATGALTNLQQIDTADISVSRVIAFDLDASGGKDLVVSSSQGELLLGRSQGESYVEDYFLALEEKLLQIGDKIAEEYPVQQHLFDLMVASLADRKLVDLRMLGEELAFRLPAEAPTTEMVREFLTVLP